MVVMSASAEVPAPGPDALPLTSVAVARRAVPTGTAVVGAKDQLPSSSTRAVPKLVPSIVKTSTVVPGSPTPLISRPLLCSMSGALGAALCTGATSASLPVSCSGLSSAGWALAEVSLN